MRATSTVVDGLREVVVGATLADVQLDVEDEALALLPLLVADAVMREEPEVVDVHGDHAIAPATVSASTVGLTSWTRRIEAPRSNAETAAAMLAPRRSSDPVSFFSELLREKPTSTGRPSASENVQPPHELEIVLDRLAEADTGVEADPLLRNPRRDCEREPLLEKARDLRRNVRIARLRLHRAWFPLHVHETEIRAGVRDDAREVGVAAQAR